MVVQRDEIIPQLIQKQEKLFDKTMLKIRKFSSLVAETTKTFGENLIKSQEYDFKSRSKLSPGIFFNAKVFEST